MTAPSLTRPFDPLIRVLDCPACGAPVEVEAIHADAISCRFCGRSLVVGRRYGGAHDFRRDAARARPPIDEPTRQAILRAKEAAPPAVPRPFDLLPLPPELTALWARAFTLSAQDMKRMRWIEQLRRPLFYLETVRTSEPELHAVFARARAEVESGRALDEGRFFFQATLMLDSFHAILDQTAARRAFLETALEVLPRVEQRDVVVCRLSRAASLAGDFEAAATWMARCDPTPVEPYLDAEVRIACAVHAWKRGDAAEVLRIVGVAPWSEKEVSPLAQHRIDALEKLGDSERAIELMIALLRKDLWTMFWLRESGMAARTLEAAVRRLDEDDALRVRNTRRGCLFLVWILVLAGVPIGITLYFWLAS